jgi:hypothetical protein
MADKAGIGDIAIEDVLELIIEFAFSGSNSSSHDDYFSLLLEPVSKLLASVFNKKKEKLKAVGAQHTSSDIVGGDQAENVENEEDINLADLFKNSMKLIHSFGSEDRQKQIMESITEILVGMGIKEFSSLKRYIPIFDLVVNMMNKNNSSNKIYDVCKKFKKDLAAQEKIILP